MAIKQDTPRKPGRPRCQWVEVPCGWCRSTIKRRKSHVDKFPSVFCDLTCQQRWRGRRKSLLCKSIKDWGLASAKAKNKYKEKRSRDRRRANPWVSLCNRCKSNLHSPTKWARRCSSAAALLRKREGVTESRAVPRNSDWGCAVQIAIKNAEGKARRANQTPWRKLCSFKASSLKKRSRLLQMKTSK